MTNEREKATNVWDLPHRFELATVDPLLGLAQCYCGAAITNPLHAVEALTHPESASAGYQGFVTEKGV